MKMKKFITYMLNTVLLAPTSLYAADRYGNEVAVEQTEYTTLEGFLEGFQNYLLGFAGALAVLFIVIGGFKYITSRGNPQAMESAKKTLTWAIAGLLVIILARVILGLITGDFLNSIFGDGTASI